MVILTLVATARAQLAPLAPTQTLQLPGNTLVAGISVGDFDGDGLVDLAWARTGPQSALEVVPGIGGGMLGVAAPIDTGRSGVRPES